MLGTSDTLEVSGKLIDWQKGIGYTEASTLDYPIRRTPIHCVAVKSHRTGAVEFFFYEGKQHLGNDCVEFHYRSGSGYRLIIADD